MNYLWRRWRNEQWYILLSVFPYKRKVWRTIGFYQAGLALRELFKSPPITGTVVRFYPQYTASQMLNIINKIGVSDKNS